MHLGKAYKLPAQRRFFKRKMENAAKGYKKLKNSQQVIKYGHLYNKILGIFKIKRYAKS